ncbi:MAG: dienelactone hydrolase family protein [Henriciella sp.]|nr:dienelactone hydrolase family protein [Henriciella sp.]
MCDETTDRELDAWLKRKALTRRGFTARASALVATGGLLTTACATPDPEAETSAEAAPDTPTALTETEVLVPTPDGEADGLFIHPASGAHAAVIFWPDIHGVRPAFFDMARDLAASGYAVLAMNPYYRSHKGRLFGDGETFRDPGGREKVGPHYSLFSPETVQTDAAALAAWLDTQAAVDTSRGIGAVGFCMTGSWTLRAAAAVPGRISAPCSFHGGGLVTEDADSPHLLAPKIKGGVLIAIAENDHEREPDAQGVLIEAFETANVPAEIEVYADAMHGWVPTDSRAHNPDQSARAWARMKALFETQLGI